MKIKPEHLIALNPGVAPRLAITDSAVGSIDDRSDPPPFLVVALEVTTPEAETPFDLVFCVGFDAAQELALRLMIETDKLFPRSKED